jgi:crotonobetainyl-CoA:carnitine CoA-transferase CaiB-like acyl-CoA transferase
MGFKALEGVRVLEYCRGISGPYCTKLMADLGAEVVHIEVPGKGDDTRRMPPFPGDVPHEEKSGLFLFLNTNKLGVTLNPQLSAGREIFRRLAGTVDVLVEDWAPGHMEEIGLGYEPLRRLNPALVMASITPFGRSGPYKDYKAYGLNISHGSGQGYMLPLLSPHLERAPVKIGGRCTDYDPGQTTAVAILAALYSRAITGKGQFIEVSQQEAVLSLQRIENVVFANSGEILTRKGPKEERTITQMFECKDGHVVSVTPLEHQKKALATLPHADGPGQPARGNGAGSPQDFEALHEQLTAWMQQHTIEEVCTKGQSLSVPISPISSPKDVATSQQMNGRGLFAEVEHPVAGRLRMPARPCRFSRTPFELARAAPLLGEHNDLIYRERLGYEERELQALQDSGVI